MGVELRKGKGSIDGGQGYYVIANSESIDKSMQLHFLLDGKAKHHDNVIWVGPFRTQAAAFVWLRGNLDWWGGPVLRNSGEDADG